MVVGRGRSFLSNTSCEPSGDQDGELSLSGVSVSCSAVPVPSALVTQMLPDLENAIRVPSGDHCGWNA